MLVIKNREIRGCRGTDIDVTTATSCVGRPERCELRSVDTWGDTW